MMGHTAAIQTLRLALVLWFMLPMPAFPAEAAPSLQPASAQVTIHPDGTGHYLYKDEFSTDKYRTDAFSLTQSDTKPLRLNRALWLVSPTPALEEATLVYLFRAPFPMKNVRLSVREITDRRNFAGHLTLAKSLDNENYIEIHPDTPSRIVDQQLGIPEVIALDLNLSDTPEYQGIQAFYVKFHLWENCGVQFDGQAALIDDLRVEAELDLSGVPLVVEVTRQLKEVEAQAARTRLAAEWRRAASSLAAGTVAQARAHAVEVRRFRRRWEEELRSGRGQWAERAEELHRLERAGAELAAASGAAKVPYCLGVATGLEKVPREGEYQGRVGSTVRLSAARNEYENFQVVVVPLNRALRGVRVEASDLKRREDDRESAPRKHEDARRDANREGTRRVKVTAHRVDYVRIENPPFPVPWTGGWPDALLPASAVTVQPGEVQPFWFTVSVPADAPAGWYEGRVRVVPAGAPPTSVQVKLRVLDFTLPPETHLRTSFWMFRYEIKDYYDWADVPWERYKEYLALVCEHRLTPFDFSVQGGTPPYTRVYLEPDGRFTFDHSQLDRYLRFVLDEHHGNAFNVGFACWFFKVFTPQAYSPFRAIERATGQEREIRYELFSPEYQRLVTDYLRDITAHLKERGWFDAAYLEAFDDAPADGQTNDVIQRLYALAKEVCPDLPRMMNLCTSAEGFKPLVGFLDIWGPMPHYLADYDFYRERQAAGDQVWWYVCYAPEPPLPNFLIPQPALDHRILFWLAWKNRIDGFFYWGLNHWTRHRRVKENVEPNPAKRWPNRPWFPAGWGDGYLIYPGPDGRPLSSIRLEVIRDGLEDYEYLYLLKQQAEAVKVPATEAQRAWLAEAEALLRLDDVARDVSDYTRSPRQLLRYRERLARLLEAWTKHGGNTIASK